MSLVTCTEVSFEYEGNVMLTGVDFALKGGEYLCIIGENGAGKSTLMKGLLGMKKPLSGTIATGLGLKREEIGYLPQQTAAQKDFPASVYEVVLSGRLNSLKWRPFYTKRDKQDALEKIKLLGLTDLIHASYQELSGGQQQRVLLARALCATKKVLLLDEPAAGLDPIVTKELYELIAKLNKEQEITVIMVSHDVHGILQYATHILHLKNRQLFFGTKEEYEASEVGQYLLEGGRSDV